jgi:ABC-type glycerol-3-phosphate transport system permease component
MRHDAGTLGRAAIYLALFAAAAFFLMPLYVVVVTSLKGVDELRRGNMLSLPEIWTVAAWIKGNCSPLRRIDSGRVKGLPLEARI